jgi:hypothetical protein
MSGPRLWIPIFRNSKPHVKENRSPFIKGMMNRQEDYIGIPEGISKESRRNPKRPAYFVRIYTLFGSNLVRI